ncbi:MAG: arsenate reductase ArsC [Candidatus Promineifilaceae bacterium]|nr:arsenate reductase ArsC [Candidatus Promineifilaceae bacterium]
MAERTVLFLCTGNSCRSQMAEGIVNHFLAGSWRAYSAGTEPSGYVHPLAISAMQEIGIDISDGESKSTEQFRDNAFELLITVCDDAAEKCPIWLGEETVKHIAFPDPAQATGDREEKMAVFRQVRDDIREHIVDALHAHPGEGTPAGSEEQV